MYDCRTAVDTLGRMRVLVDTTPLRVSRDFRQLFVGQSVSVIGTTVAGAALPFQLYDLTGSSLAVGLLGVAELGPLLVFSLVGGALADSIDKRRLMLGLTTAAMACSVGMAINASLAHPQVWAIYVLAALTSAVFGARYPVHRALVPLLLGDDLRPAGYALQATLGSLGMMIGPAVGGVLIAAWGFPVAYGLDAVSYVFALVAYAGLSPSPPFAGAARASRDSVVEGLRFLRGQPVILSVFGVDLLAMVFGFPRALFPALTERLGGGPTLYGLLLASVAAGAFLASVLSGWTVHVKRSGRAILIAVTAWGAAITVVGITREPAIVLAMLLCAGAADMISGVYRSTIAAEVTPDELRGRVSGVEFAVYAGGPVLGDVEAGVVGGLLGVPFAIVSGGIACVVGAALFAVLVPSFARYVRPTTDDAAPAGASTST
jgi:MFS family permease